MRRMTPLVLMGVVLASCAGNQPAIEPIDPTLAQATIEVKGMS